MESCEQHTNNDMFGQTATNLQRNVFATNDHVFVDNEPTNINQSTTNDLFADAETNHQSLVFVSIPPTDCGLSPNDNLCSQAAKNQPTSWGLEDHLEKMLLFSELQTGRASEPQLRRPTPRMGPLDLSLPWALRATPHCVQKQKTRHVGPRGLIPTNNYNQSVVVHKFPIDLELSEHPPISGMRT